MHVHELYIILCYYIIVSDHLVGGAMPPPVPTPMLIDSLERDSDLSLVPSQDLPAILRTLYVSTGCDYIFLLRTRKEQLLELIL